MTWLLLPLAFAAGMALRLWLLHRWAEGALRHESFSDAVFQRWRGRPMGMVFSVASGFAEEKEFGVLLDEVRETVRLSSGSRPDERIGEEIGSLLRLRRIVEEAISPEGVGDGSRRPRAVELGDSRSALLLPIYAAALPLVGIAMAGVWIFAHVMPTSWIAGRLEKNYGIDASKVVGQVGGVTLMLADDDDEDEAEEDEDEETPAPEDDR